jgi:hypothetical protein
MNFQPGDWVRTESDEVGTVIHIARLSVFVRLDGQEKPENVRAFLESELTRIDPPQEPTGPTTPLHT